VFVGSSWIIDPIPVDLKKNLIKDIIANLPAAGRRGTSEAISVKTDCFVANLPESR